MTHSHVTLNVKGRGAGEPECFQIGVNLRLVNVCMGPGSTEWAH
jgi:hypothetical protein